MTSSAASTKELAGTRVVVHGKRGDKRIGKVHRFVFHPRAKRVVGFTVKRPDVALMFRRAEMFVAIGGYDMVDGRVVVRDEPTASGSGAIKALGIDYDACVLWVGMPAMTRSGETLGFVGDVAFDACTGKVFSVEIESGAASDVIVGKRAVPASLIEGFSFGVGVQLAAAGSYHGEEPDEDEEALRGAIIVADSAEDIPTEGGAAEAVGKASAVVANRAKETVAEAKPVVKEAARKTGEAINKGAYAAGKQIGRTQGMFAAFKREYDKAVRDDAAPATKKRN